MMANKYRNKKVILDGIEFDSRKEAQRWFELRMLERAKEIANLQRQVKYVLIPSQKIDGKTVERECAYIADFVYTEKDGQVVVEDTKGFRTDAYIIKRKLMLERYGIRIREI
jgi:hypothetical protein